jgi:hypothetical protein
VIKLWTYKGKGSTGDIGIVVSKEGSEVYYKFYYRYLLSLFPSNKKRRKLTWKRFEDISTQPSTFTYFPSDFCKPRYFQRTEIIYLHEIFRLLRK